MGSDTVADLVGRLPALKEEHDRLGKLIQALEAFAGGPMAASPAAAEHGHHPGNGKAIRPDQFFGKSTAQAIKEYLAVVRAPMGPRALAEGLVQGGQGVDVETVYANVASALKRMRKNDEVVQVRRNHWGLSSWYGANRKRALGAKKQDAGTNGEVGDETETELGEDDAAGDEGNDQANDEAGS